MSQILNTDFDHLDNDPVHDPARLEEIARLEPLSAETTALLQATVEDVARRFGLPIALASIVLDEAQCFAATCGLSGWLAEAGGTPGEWSFCANTIRSRAPFIVEDAACHPCTQDNPLVRMDGIRCYAGAPLITSRGHVLGALCVIGTEPRAFAPSEIAYLQDAAARAVRLIEDGPAAGA